MVRLCGAALGFLAFSVTILLGLLADNPVEVTLLRAVWALVSFCVIGMTVGWVAYRVLDEHALSKQREMFAALEHEEEQETADAQETGQQEAGASEAESQKPGGARQVVAGG